MAEVGQVVEATVVAVRPSTRIGSYRHAGSCTVECDWGRGKMSYVLVDGSVQGIPDAERAVGRKIYLRWARAGSYHGPVFHRVESRA